MSTASAASPALYFDTIFAYQRSAALKAALDLELFTVIGSESRTAQDMAKAMGVAVRGIRILCDYLASVGFLMKTADTYTLTRDSSVFLAKGSPAYLGETARFLYSTELTDHFDRLTETIRRGAAPAAMLAPDYRAWVEFARAMVPMMMPSAQAIADVLDAASARPTRVLDIAAGHGIFGIVLAQRYPAAEIVAVDWAPVLEVATENAKAMGVDARHRTLAGDAFTVEYGTGFDIALVTNFLHHFDRPANVTLLKKIAAALSSGGRIVVLEFVPNDDRVTPPMAAQFSLSMLAGTPSGDAYTFPDLRGMLGDAGFSQVVRHLLQGPQTVLVARK